MNQLNLSLSIEEANLLLKAASQLPYIQVHELIAKIQQQTYPQLEALQKERAEQQAEVLEKVEG